MTKAVLAGVVALSTALSVIGFHNLIDESAKAGPVEDYTAAAHHLATACYQEGFQKGRMDELVKRLKEMDVVIPPNIQKLFDAPPTEGCRK